MTHRLYLTHIGQAKIAQAINSGNKSLQITKFAVGQGQDVDFSQRLDQPTLVDQRYQNTVSGVQNVAGKLNEYEITCTIPPNVGGFFIREIGLFDSDGDLIWVGSLPEVEKPSAGSLSAVDYHIKCIIAVDNAEVNLVVDANIILANKDWVTETFVLKTEFDHHLNANDPHPQYANKLFVGSMLHDLIKAVAELRKRPVQAIPVGGIFTTTIHYADGNAVNQALGYGRWQQIAMGEVLVGASSALPTSQDMFAIGKRGGKREHTLTIEQMPNHKHSQNNVFNKFVAIAHDVIQRDDNHSDKWIGTEGKITTADVDDRNPQDELMINSFNANSILASTEQSIGNNQPFSLMQPYRVVAYWLRLPDEQTNANYRLYWTSDSEGNNIITSTKDGNPIYLWLEAQNLQNVNRGTLASPHFESREHLGYHIENLRTTLLQNGKNLIFSFPQNSYTASISTTLTMGVNIISDSPQQKLTIDLHIEPRAVERLYLDFNLGEYVLYDNDKNAVKLPSWRLLSKTDSQITLPEFNSQGKPSLQGNDIALVLNNEDFHGFEYISDHPKHLQIWLKMPTQYTEETHEIVVSYSDFEYSLVQGNYGGIFKYHMADDMTHQNWLVLKFDRNKIPYIGRDYNRRPDPNFLNQRRKVSVIVKTKG